MFWEADIKILQIISTFTDAGAERFVIDLCNTLAQKGYEVILVSFYPAPTGKEFVNDWLGPDIKHIVLNKKLGLDISIFRWNYDPYSFYQTAF
jgi:hypothetical protein